MNPPDVTAAGGSAPYELRDVRLAEGTVRVTVLGRGRPALFLHGVSAHGRSWRAAAERFSTVNPGWACWLPDLLGRGASEAPPGCRYTLADELRRVRELIAALGSAAAAAGGVPALVAGHSQGAAIGLALAAVEPDVRGLVLSNPITLDIRRPRALGALRSAAVRAAAGSLFAPLHRPLGHLILRRAGGPRFRLPPEARDAYSRPYRNPARARTLMRILADWRPAELAAHMPARSLEAHVLAGAHDPRVPAPAAERLARTLACDFTLFEDGGHVLPEQHPDRIAEVLTEVARRLTASAA